MNNKKIFVLGLDGATFDIINPLIEQGHLPNLKKLIEKGSSGVLKSTIPPISAPAWTSFATGVNPDKHGIFDFVYQDENYEYHLHNSNNIKVKTLWEILSLYNKKSIIVNMPMTYPPKKISGIIIPGMLTPGNNFKTYPPELKEKINKNIKNYVVEPSLKQINTSPKTFFKTIMIMTKKRKKLLFYLLKKDWDLFIIVFRGFDLICHRANKKNYILRYLKYIDGLIKDLLKILDKNVTLILISDHGFRECKYYFNTNKWLEKNKLLKRKRDKDFSFKSDFFKELLYKKRNLKLKYYFKKINITQEKINHILYKLNLLYLLKKLIPNHFKNKFPKSNQIIDWKNTNAYLSSAIGQTLKINLKKNNRLSEYNKLKKIVIHKLKKIKNSDGEYIFKKIYSKEEIYSNIIKNMPDIFILDENEIMFNGNFNFDMTLISHPSLYTHNSNGIFIMYGNYIRKNKILKELYLVDIASTLLYLLNVNLPQHVDGKIIYDAFRKSYLKNNKLHYSEIEFNSKI